MAGIIYSGYRLGILGYFSWRTCWIGLIDIVYYLDRGTNEKKEERTRFNDMLLV